jgi:carbon monoxide dehydrogenase subunit G
LAAARWKGKVRLSDFDPPNSYRISGEGDGGVAGFAKGTAKVSLA